ncbi:EEF1A lysine methyltransferase 3 [Macadamia integrifolia]|uniref:EEF1A lysine methyltransferase 3 n=1 Tax=Macadamia integrifolia TaxID=60698 RepID=UPI001C4F279F|nr:EEF1A lysine methyltransferase 3 [Macadamia integrifolia]XP_042496004.1 EEF1A lysine methyltransferase 3 [Macadamia integrifolia]
MTIKSDEEDDLNFMNVLQGDVLEEEEEGREATLVGEDTDVQEELEQHYFLGSIKSSVMIRQVPSEGIPFKLWPAAKSLVNHLDKYRLDPSSSPLTLIFSAFSNVSQNSPLRILELGSGTGLVGITAAATLGASVTLTDLPYVVPNLQFNVDANCNTLTLNGGTINVAALRWGEAEDMESIGREFDLLLASDVVYQDHLFDPLLKTLQFYLRNNTVFVMAHLKRWKKKDSVFFKKARKLFDIDMIHSDPPSSGSRIGVAVYHFKCKCQDGSKSKINVCS